MTGRAGAVAGNGDLIVNPGFPGEVGHGEGEQTGKRVGEVDACEHGRELGRRLGNSEWSEG